VADEVPEVAEPADAWTYATDRVGARAVRAEAAALTSAGLSAELAVPDELPFPTTAAVRLVDQLRLDPGALVSALLQRLEHLGVPVVWPMRARAVRSIGEGFEVLVAPDGGSPGPEARPLRSDWVVLATLLPFPLRTALFATASAQMSYAVVGQPTTATVPEGMYLSTGQPTRSLRAVRAGDGRELLLVGGSGHPVGRDLPNSAHVTELIGWAEQTYGMSRVEHRWAAHDYVSADLMPHIGAAPFGPPRLLVATGFGKWGMTNGAAAAVSLAGTILGSPPAWAPALAPRVGGGIAGWGRLAAANLETGLALVRGWVADPGGDEPADEGSGVVRRAVPHPRAVSRTGGARRDCRAVCTHLGGIVRWNDVDQTWDCPLHGSRFDGDGSVLTGPAVTELGP
jgi:glycine/D-amino acid oxidase-like deaminating enzyme